jgi:hypothetical protein
MALNVGVNSGRGALRCSTPWPPLLVVSKDELGDTPKPSAGTSPCTLFSFRFSLLTLHGALYPWGVQRGGAPLRLF